MAQLKFPRVLVTIERSDGTEAELTVQTDNRDAVRFDLLRARKGWPPMADAPLLFMTALAWLAIRRSDAAAPCCTANWPSRCCRAPTPPLA